MKDQLNIFLKPTKLKIIITIIIYLPVPLVLYGRMFIPQTFSLLAFYFILMVMYIPIYIVLYPFMVVGDPFFPEPNPYGYMAFLVLSLVYAYVIACILEKLIYRLRPRPNSAASPPKQ
jgi:hypothetical protein